MDVCAERECYRYIYMLYIYIYMVLLVVLMLVVVVEIAELIFGICGRAKCVAERFPKMSWK